MEGISRTEFEGMQLIMEEYENRLSEIEKRYDDIERKIESRSNLAEKVHCLRHLLEAQNIDEEQTQVGSETKYKPLLDDTEVQKVKKKIWELMGKM